MAKRKYKNTSLTFCLMGLLYDRMLKQERQAPPQLALPFSPPVDMPVTGSFDDLDWDEE